jgi:hypothetical protein
MTNGRLQAIWESRFMVKCKTGFIINQYGRKSEILHKFN